MGDRADVVEQSLEAAEDALIDEVIAAHGRYRNCRPTNGVIDGKNSAFGPYGSSSDVDRSNNGALEKSNSEVLSQRYRRRKMNYNWTWTREEGESIPSYSGTYKQDHQTKRRASNGPWGTPRLGHAGRESQEATMLSADSNVCAAVGAHHNENLCHSMQRCQKSQHTGNNEGVASVSRRLGPYDKMHNQFYEPESLSGGVSGGEAQGSVLGLETNESVSKLLSHKYGHAAASNFNCPVCAMVISDPVIAPCCGETMCRSCVKTGFSENRMRSGANETGRCPLCGDAMSIGDVVHNAAMQQALYAVVVSSGKNSSTRNNHCQNGITMQTRSDSGMHSFNTDDAFLRSSSFDVVTGNEKQPMVSVSIPPMDVNVLDNLILGGLGLPSRKTGQTSELSFLLRDASRSDACSQPVLSAVLGGDRSKASKVPTQQSVVLAGFKEMSREEFEELKQMQLELARRKLGRRFRESSPTMTCVLS